MEKPSQAMRQAGRGPRQGPEVRCGRVTNHPDVARIVSVFAESPKP